MPAPYLAISPELNTDPKQRPDLELDITAYLCPMTFVRTRLALDRLRPGQILAVRMKGDEPKTNVPKTAAEQGHTILAQDENPDGTTTVLIRKRP
jgi:tRNA 2-thiouridine synthesizing protein A